MAAPWSCSSFAQEQLVKHGWKDGQGLGRTESGISEAIKVKIKHDTAGVGHDLGEQFTYHWWDHVFNKAANNIVVEKDQDGVKLSRKENIKGPISNKKLSKDRGKKPLLYGNFVKSATLTNEGLQQDGSNDASLSSSEDENCEEMNIDDKFFKACGGRTAHKGARHGLNLSGKLKRIQAQEENGQLPWPMKGISTKNPKPSLRDNDEGPSDEELKDRKRLKKQRRKEKKRIFAERTVDGSHLEPVTEVDISDIATDDGKAYNVISTSDDNDRKKNKKKMRKKTVENRELNNHEYSADEAVTKKTKRSRTVEVSPEYATVDVRKERKRRKHKRKNTEENGNIDHEYSIDNHEYSIDNQELISGSDSKAARKQVNKDKRNREMNSSSSIADVKLEKSNKKINQQVDAFVSNNLDSEKTDRSKKPRKRKARHSNSDK